MKAIIFDMDGLMIDTEKLYFEVEKEIASEFNKTVPQELMRSLMGMSPKEAARIFIDNLKINMTIDEFLEIRGSKMEYKYKNQLEPMKGLFEIIDEFYPKLDLAIATGSPKRFLDIVVDKLKIRNYFKVLQASDEIKNGKPDPEIYIETINKLKLKPEECFVLEDSSNGARAGKLAGCYTIAVKNVYSYNEDFGFTDYVADDLIKASAHIKNIINKKKVFKLDKVV
jgi:HAD superfamily hydrolase (TIGR01509 family)